MVRFTLTGGEVKLNRNRKPDNNFGGESSIIAVSLKMRKRGNQSFKFTFTLRLSLVFTLTYSYTTSNLLAE